MVVRATISFCVAFVLMLSGTTCRNIRKKPPHNHDYSSAKNNIHMTHVKPTAQPADIIISNSTTSLPKKTVEPVEKPEQTLADVSTDDMIRGRGPVTFTRQASYAEIQPKKSLIGACIAFAVYFLGTMLYNYIRKILEQDRVAKAMRDYEQEKEHFIETGETIDVAGAGV